MHASAGVAWRRTSPHKNQPTVQRIASQPAQRAARTNQLTVQRMASRASAWHLVQRIAHHEHLINIAFFL
jgi:hypothetical protein